MLEQHVLGLNSLSPINPSRPIPTAIDLVIGPNDAVLLQYAYSVEGTFWASCFKQFAIEYGYSISHAGLRHAMLAMAACESRSIHMEEQIEYHRKEACRQIMRSINKPSTLNDGDAYTANILAWVGF